MQGELSVECHPYPYTFMEGTPRFREHFLGNR